MCQTHTHWSHVWGQSVESIGNSIPSSLSIQQNLVAGIREDLLESWYGRVTKERIEKLDISINHLNSLDDEWKFNHLVNLISKFIATSASALYQEWKNSEGKNLIESLPSVIDSVYKEIYTM
jgi:hypothetical protein